MDPAYEQPFPIPIETGDAPPLWEPRRKFQDRVWLHVLLLVLTIGSTTLVGVNAYLGFVADFVPLQGLPMPLPRRLRMMGVLFAIGKGRITLGIHSLL